MKKVTVSNWDPAKYIVTKEDVIAHLEVALEENDYEFLLETMRYIARSKGMAQLSRELDRTGVGDISAKGSPSIATVFTALDNLGFHFKAERKTA
jgi:probable addiction module antidote protein